jgi:hypothetical protein
MVFQFATEQRLCGAQRGDSHLIWGHEPKHALRSNRPLSDPRSAQAISPTRGENQ